MRRKGIVLNGPIHTGRQIKNNLRKKSIKGQILSGQFLWHLPISAFQLFCSNFLYSSNVYFSFTWLLTLTIFSDKIKGQILSDNFCQIYPYQHSNCFIYFYYSNVFFNVFGLLKTWLVRPLKGQAIFETKSFSSKENWGAFHHRKPQE